MAIYRDGQELNPSILRDWRPEHQSRSTGLTGEREPDRGPPRLGVFAWMPTATRCQLAEWYLELPGQWRCQQRVNQWQPTSALRHRVVDLLLSPTVSTAAGLLQPRAAAANVSCAAATILPRRLHRQLTMACRTTCTTRTIRHITRRSLHLPGSPSISMALLGRAIPSASTATSSQLLQLQLRSTIYYFHYQESSTYYAGDHFDGAVCRLTIMGKEVC